jgi:two-component system sensor histidine kinase YesM
MMKLLRIYKSKLAVKQFLFLFAVLAVLFLSLALKNLNDAEGLIRSQVITDSQVVVNRTNQLLDAYIENIQNLLQLIVNSQDTFLSGDEAQIQKTFRAYTENVGSIAKTLYFIREDGKVYSSRQAYFDVFGNPELLSRYKIARENYGAINWTEPYPSLVSGNTVAFVRPGGGRQKNAVGTAVVEIDLEMLTLRLGTLLISDYQSFAVMTSKDHFVSLDLNSPLLPYEYVEYKKKLKDTFARQLFELSEGANEIQGKQNKLVAIRSQANRLNWRVISMIDEAYFYKNIHLLNANHRNAAIVWIVILLVSVWILSRFTTKPIRILVAKMNRIREFETNQLIAVDREDEIGDLAKSYNSLLSRVQYLIRDIKEIEQSKKEYELKMLQSQIGPHFLYNTLACINSLAKQGKTEEVRETIRSLGGLLRFSFDKTSEYVTLEEELKGLQMYVQIQKVRYGDQFTVQYEIPEELLSCRMLKLTLQPIVENAIYHGLAPKEQEGTIHVTARAVSGGRIKLYIVDNGIGIAPDYRKTLLLHRGNTRSEKAFNSVGLINVHERIRIHFGEMYGLKIASRKDVGTVVRIELPHTVERYSS